MKDHLITSAGTLPEPVNPNAINALNDIGIDISNNNLNEFKIKNIILTSPDGETLEAELELALNNFKITIDNIFLTFLHHVS